MPEHNSFFPENKGYSKSTNAMINIPIRKIDDTVKAKGSNYTPKQVSNLNNNPILGSLSNYHKPQVAKDTPIKSKSQSFFSLV